MLGILNFFVAWIEYWIAFCKINMHPRLRLTSIMHVPCIAPSI